MLCAIIGVPLRPWIEWRYILSQMRSIACGSSPMRMSTKVAIDDGDVFVADGTADAGRAFVGIDEQEVGVNG